VSHDEDLHEEQPVWPDDPVPESTLHPDRTPVIEEHPETDVVTFWDIVRRQFMANHVAVFALRSVQFLIVIAIASPLIALNIPFFMSSEAGIESPLFAKLFDRLVFKGGVDVFFNLLLIMAPIWIVTGRICKAAALSGGRPNRNRLIRNGIAGALLVIFVAILGVKAHSIYWKILGFALAGSAIIVISALSSGKLPPREARHRAARARYAVALVFGLTFALTLFSWKYTSETVIYRTKIAELRKNDTGSALSPPIFFHPDNAADDNSVALDRPLKPPSLKHRNLLGTDNNGRDVFTRLLYGTRISLTIGIIAVSIYVTIGIILGSFAGYFGGKVDLFIMFVLQVMLCIPTFFLLLTIIALFDTRSIFMIMVAIGLTGWTGVTRLIRGEFFRQRSIEYVTAAKCLGIPERRIIFGHILKNSVGPVLVAAAFGIAGAILAESFLSFLGLGDSNAPSWGQVLAEGRTHRKNWLIFSPGIAIFFVVTILNLVGEGLRDALDPKLRH
jgi:peptide/nickel transport system permease protein